jgi:hypothetical protein
LLLYKPVSDNARIKSDIGPQNGRKAFWLNTADRDS